MTTLARSFLIVAIATAGILVMAPDAQAATLDAAQKKTLLSEANNFFNQANDAAPTNPAQAKDLYGKAILRYQRLIDEGGVRNGKLFYDLGNAYYLTGDLGRAIVNYLRAAQYLPNDPNLNQNLSYVRSQRMDRLAEPQRTRVLKTLFFWHYDLSSKVRMALFAVFFLTLWGAATARLFFRRTALNWTIALSAAVALLFLGSLTVDGLSHAQNTRGVVVAKEVVARMGNGETYQPSFQEPLHAGTEFSMLEDRGDWYHVQLPDNRECWLPRQSLELVRNLPGAAAPDA